MAEHLQQRQHTHIGHPRSPPPPRRDGGDRRPELSHERPSRILTRPKLPLISHTPSPNPRHFQTGGFGTFSHRRSYSRAKRKKKPSKAKGKKNPAEPVSWIYAVEFCKTLSAAMCLVSSSRYRQSLAWGMFWGCSSISRSSSISVFVSSVVIFLILVSVRSRWPCPSSSHTHILSGPYATCSYRRPRTPSRL